MTPARILTLEHTLRMLEGFVMRLLVLPLIIAGISDTVSLEVTFQCSSSVCYHIWRFTPIRESIDVVITSNGEMMQSAGVNYQDLKCTEKLQRLTEDNIGRHYCKITDDAFTPQNEVPEFKVAPGFDVTFQCTLLSFLTLRRCSKPRRSDVRLTWVDRAGREVRDNLSYRISRKSPCDVTLTVTLRAPGSEEFRCQAWVGRNSWTSAEMRVQVPVPKGKGKGRGDFNLKEVEPQGNGHYQVGVVVAVLACATLTALAAMFVVVRRRKAAQLPEASCPIAIHNDVADDIIYADVILPVGAESVSFSQGQDTEYACIRYR